MKRLSPMFLGLILWCSVAEAQTTIYWKKDYIRDASGAAIATATPAPSDTTVPSTPGTPTQSTVTTSSVTISWSASTDSGGSSLAGYIIYRGAVPVGAVATTNFTDLGLTANTAYSYHVVAFDNAHNYSNSSGTLNVTTANSTVAPASLTATASSTSQVNLAWSSPTGGAPHHYGVWRLTSGSWSKINTTSSTSYNDTTVSATTTYLYQISAEDGSSNVQGWTNWDIATTIVFTDDTITVGSTVIKAAHITELRTAVNAVRAAAGLGAASWTNSVASGAWIDADDVLELRTSLGPAINALYLVPPNYIDSVLTGATIKKSHIEQLRQRVK